MVLASPNAVIAMITRGVTRKRKTPKEYTVNQRCFLAAIYLRSRRRAKSCIPFTTARVTTIMTSAITPAPVQSERLIARW